MDESSEKNDQPDKDVVPHDNEDPMTTSIYMPSANAMSEQQEESQNDEEPPESGIKIPGSQDDDKFGTYSRGRTPPKASEAPIRNMMGGVNRAGGHELDVLFQQQQQQKNQQQQKAEKPEEAVAVSKVPGESGRHGTSVIIEEMRRYYESEIALLRHQLQSAGGNTDKPSEEALYKKSLTLESHLRRAQNESESLAEQVAGLRTQLEAWPARVSELEDENNTLRLRINEVRALNQQKQAEIEDMQEMARTLEAKLWEAGGTGRHERILLQRMMDEYDNLVKDYDLVKAALISGERKLYDVRTELAEQTRRVSQLELDLQKVESENNFLRRRSLAERSNSSGWFVNCPPLSTYERDFQRKTLPHDRKMNLSGNTGPGSGNVTGTHPTKSSGGCGSGGIPNMMSMSCYGALPSISTQESMQLTSEEEDAEIERELHTPVPMQEKAKEMTNTSTPQAGMRRSVAEQSGMAAFALGDERDREFGTFQQTSFARFQHNRGLSSLSRIPVVAIGRKPVVSEVPATTNSNTRFMGGMNNSSKMTQSVHSRGMFGEDEPGRSEDVRNLEKRYDETQMEKRRLETALSHIPTSSSSRNRRQLREQREKLEARLDHVDHDLGMMRMTLKQINVLK